MTDLKDQIAEKIRQQREQSEKPRQDKYKKADADNRIDNIRPQLDELAHATDNYSLEVSYPIGPYAETIAVLELDDADGTWTAAWQVSTTVSDPVHQWEVAYNPRGVDVQRKWFRDSEALFAYLTASIAERVVEMEAAGRD